MKRIALSVGAAVALAAMALGTASAQNVPSGSYQQSCTNIRVRGDVLTARCTAPQGSRVRSSIDLNSCRGGDIANTNGQLTCNTNGYGHRQYNGQNGRGYGNGSNGSYGSNGGYGMLPPGSYQQSCTNAAMRGSMLSATCPGNGSMTSSTLNASACRGADIANINGRLQCH